MSVHLVLDVTPAERAEHLTRLILEVLSRLAAAVEEPEDRFPFSPGAGAPWLSAETHAPRPLR